MPPETNVAEPPVVTAPVITVVETPVVTPEPAPEVDLLTRVGQFKAPVVEDKIVNPPEQPEFAKITDPIAREAAKEAVERMRRGMQSDYTTKLSEAQKLVNQSKSWTPQRIQQELLTNPEFVQAAQMIQGQQAAPTSLTQEAYSALTDAEKAAVNLVPELQNELKAMKQKATEEQIVNAITQKDVTLRTKFPDYDSKIIDQACKDLAQSNIADVREYVYKSINYDKNVRNAYEMGKLEGQGKLNSKLNVIAPQGTTVTSNEGVPKKIAGESDKNFFIRLGQFRQAQYKTQK